MSESATAVRYAGLGLAVGTPDIESVGAIAFGPDGVLFVADNAQASIFALGFGPAGPAPDSQAFAIENLDARLASRLGCSREDVSIRDMAVCPLTGEAYLSVMRGSGSDAIPVIARVGDDGQVTDVSLEGIPFARTTIEDAPDSGDERIDIQVLPDDSAEGEQIETGSGVTLRIAREDLRTVTVTDMSYVDGMLLVAGASNEEFSSTLRRIPFPFNEGAQSNSLEIFHVSHGKYETASPIRTFVPYNGDSSILASYTCTPIVHFSLSDMQPATHIMGSTVAELGSMNSPTDMVSYRRDGEEYLLVATARLPLVRIACADIDGQESLTEPDEPLGVPREALSHAGVVHMANLDDGAVLMLQQDGDGAVGLHSYECASL